MPSPEVPPFVVPIGSTMQFGSGSPYAATVVDAFTINDAVPFSDMSNNYSQGWVEEVAQGMRQMKIQGCKIAFKADGAPVFEPGQQWTVAISPAVAAKYDGLPTLTGKWNIKSRTLPVFDMKNGWVTTIDMDSTGPITEGVVTGGS